MRKVEGVLRVVLGCLANVAGDDLAIDSPEMVRKSRLLLSSNS
jgi:hypothetical protein